MSYIPDSAQPVHRSESNPAQHVENRAAAAAAQHSDVWKAFIFQVNWIVARKFQFQTFAFTDSKHNGTVNAEDAEHCVPSTAFLAADHLAQLLVTDAMPRESGDETRVDTWPVDKQRLAFGRAVWRLHETIFSPYRVWADHQRIPDFPPKHVRGMWEGPLHGHHQIATGLLDLCLYMCLWTEAANLKHMPESLWFLFWAMRNSDNYQQLFRQLASDGLVPEPFGRADKHLLRLRALRILLRNSLRSEVLTVRKEAVERDGLQLPININRGQAVTRDFDWLTVGVPVDSAVKHFPGIDAARAQLRGRSDVPGHDTALAATVLADLIFLGDGGMFMERIITPIFQALAYEVSKKGGGGCEAALRVTYDDANESFVLPSNVQRMLRVMKVTLPTGQAGEEAYDRGAASLFDALWRLGETPSGFSVVAARRYWTGEAEHRERIERMRPGFLVKTYQERRTWLALFRAYYRVVTFHVLWFHVLLGLAFARDQVAGPDRNSFEGRWWVPISGAVITHAVLEFIYGYAGIFVQLTVPPPPVATAGVRSNVSRVSGFRGLISAMCCCLCPRAPRKAVGLDATRDLVPLEHDHEDSMLWRAHRVQTAQKLTGAAAQMLTWLLLLSGLVFLFIAQFSWFPWPDDKPAGDPDRVVIGGKAPAQFFRDVWPFVAAIYAGVFAGLWLVSMRPGYVTTETSAFASLSSCWGSCVNCMGWQGTAAGKAFAAGEYVSVAPRVHTLQFVRNVIFWAFVLGLKFCVDFLLILSTVPDPIRGLLKQDWLGTCGADLEIGDSGVPCVENMVLVAALCLPIFLVVMFDTGILYQVGVFVYGCANGLANLGLGHIVTWNDLIKQFERGAEHCSASLLTTEAATAWKQPDTVRAYYALLASRAAQQAVAAEGGGREDQRAAAARAAAAAATVPRANELDQLSQAQLNQYSMWTPFAEIWDSIVLDLRLADYISSEEELNLKFQTCHLLRNRPYNLKPLILPVCFFAGKVQQTLDNGTIDHLGSNVLLDAYQLLLVTLCQLGFIDDADYAAFSTLALEKAPQNYYHTQVRDSMIAAMRKFITQLESLKPKGETECPNADSIKKDVVKSFAAIAENLAIELSYTAALERSPKVTQQVGSLKEIIEAKRPRDGSRARHGVYLDLVEGAHGQLQRSYGLAPGSRLDLHLDALSGRALPPAAGELPAGDIEDLRRLIKVLKQAMFLTEQQSQPANEEACRVLRFFMSALFNPQLCRPASLDRGRSLTTLVPHYAEGVIYPLDAAEVEARTGVKAGPGEVGELVHPMKGFEVSTIEFLRVQFHDEWLNFVERLFENYGIVSGVSAADVTERDFRLGGGGVFADNERARMDLMLWASDRGQMLARTVKGMMMYEKALLQLELLESCDDRGGRLSSLVEAKYRHIVSSQVYGKMKNSKKAADQWLAKSVDFLMAEYPTFRVAYIDDAAGRGYKVPQSVLMRWDTEAGAPEELYRITLPWQTEDGRGVILGEGKPENQNHAVVFCFGESLQTVDMNQENRLAEAFKMRNLLSEFDRKSGRGGEGGVTVAQFRREVARKAGRLPPVAIVGFREWIFSGKAGSLGLFAAGAEFAFGTIVQRTMAEPGGARFHYGHPDVWNKLFCMTRGGVSKATRAFHISEDVFGGYNAIFRGGVIKYREYISVGKARDVGFEQINGFEAKVSGGNGEQSISRDVFRLGTRLDWFRLMSWYHSGIGFFVNTALTMASVYLSVWLIFVFALSDSLTVRNGGTATSPADSQLIASVNTVQIVQLGFLSIIPYWGELCLETGFLEGSLNILRQMVAGSLLFFIFRQQTSAHYFTQIATYGGAKYIATGRGFALTHTPYVNQFTAFGRSHIYFGLQLAFMAILLAFIGIDKYGRTTWGTWLVAVALVFSPFWFNPSTFQTDVVWADFQAWRKWMQGATDSGTRESWIVFHRGQLEKARNVGGRQTDHTWNRLHGILMQFFNVVLLIALVENVVSPDYRTVVSAEGEVVQEEVSGSVRRKVSGLIAFEIALAAVVLLLALQRTIRTFGASARRYIGVLGAVSFVALLVVYLVLIGQDASAGLTAIVLLAAANYIAATIVVQLCLYGAPYHRLSLLIIDAGYYAADTIAGLVIFTVVFLLSLVPIVDSIQGLLLFNYELMKESRTGQQLKQFLARRGRAGGANILGGATEPLDKKPPPPAGGAGDGGALPPAAAGLPPGAPARLGDAGTGTGTGGTMQISGGHHRTQYANLGATIASTQRAGRASMAVEQRYPAIDMRISGGRPADGGGALGHLPRQRQQSQPPAGGAAI